MEKIIRSFKDLNHLKGVKEIACLDSGGLDSAYMLTRLLYTYPQITIHVLTVNIGQEDALPVKVADWVEKRIIRHTVDAKKEFVSDFVLPLLHAHGVYGKQHPLSASLSRPLIAKHLVELAERFTLGTILHAATPSQNSMRRFNGAIKDLNYQGLWGSPYLIDNYSREDKAKYVIDHGGTVPTSRTFSIDSNLFCREFESGTLRNPENILPPENLYYWTRDITKEREEQITITFKQGIPVQIDGKKFEPFEIVERLNTLIGSYGLGRYQGLEEGPSGLKVLEVREAPAAFILLESLNELINAIHSHSVIIAKSQLEQLWTREASEGRWFGVLKSAIDSFNQVVMKEISGQVTFNLRPYCATCIGVIADKPLYSLDRDLLELASNIKEKEVA